MREIMNCMYLVDPRPHRSLLSLRLLYSSFYPIICYACSYFPVSMIHPKRNHCYILESYLLLPFTSCILFELLLSYFNEFISQGWRRAHKHHMLGLSTSIKNVLLPIDSKLKSNPPSPCMLFCILPYFYCKHAAILSVECFPSFKNLCSFLHFYQLGKRMHEL